MANLSIVDNLSKSGSDRAAIQAKIDAINADAMANWGDTQWRKDMAQELTETIYFGFTHENLISQVFDVESLAFDQRSFLREVRGLRSFIVARGGYIEESTMREDVAEIPRLTIGFHVSEFEDKLMTNFAETQATLVSRSIERMDAQVNSWAMSLVRAASPTDGSLSNFGTVAGAGTVLPALNNAMRKVLDRTQSTNVSIIGRSTMTNRILDDIIGIGNNGAGYVPATNEQILQGNQFGRYRGANIVTLNNWRDDMDQTFFPANELLVVTQDCAKFAFFGGMMAKEFNEDDNWYWHYLARRDFGGLVHRPDRIFRLIDSTQPAQ